MLIRILPLLSALVLLLSGVTTAEAACGEARVLRFAQHDWKVKCSDQPVGPGPNHFSDSNDNVWVDKQGRLHLKVTHRGGRWYAAELISVASFGYGTYRFHVDTPAGELEPQLVLGLFTWSDDPAYHHREIDVEISRWGRPDNKNGQFVIQPYNDGRNIVRFPIPTQQRYTIYSFTWKPDSVSCQAVVAGPKRPTVIRRHVFTSGIPQAGGENARMNLWLIDGAAPANGRDVEVIVSKFEFEKWF